MEHEGYHLIRRLGTGGSGTVWLALDPLGGRVAIKMLHPGLAATEQARTRLIREATTVNSIKSEQVAHVLDVEADQTQPFVVSDFVDGPTLKELLAEGPLPPNQVASLATILCDVLHQVHVAHVVHRDIKPSNVIMSTTGPVLIDFGIAMSAGDERLTSTGLISGTLGFTAPELLRGQDPSSATDWWGWAATVLNAATGRPPFGVGQEALIRTDAGQPDVEGLPAPVAHVLVAALDPDPSRRPTPEDVCHVLNQPTSWQVDPAASTQLFPIQAPVQVLVQAPAQVPIQNDEDSRTQVLPQSAQNDEDFRIEVMPGSTQNDEHFRTQALPIMPQMPADSTQGLPALPMPGYSIQPFAQPPFVQQPFPQIQMPYVQRRPRPATWVIVAVLAALAAIPVFASSVGMIGAVVVLILFATLGAGNSWIERRRVRFGAKHRGDEVWAVLATPWHLLKGAAGLALSLIPGMLVGAGAWVGVCLTLKPHRGVPELRWLWDYLLTGADRAGWTTNPVWQPICWGVFLITLLVASVMPTSRPMRRGIQLAAQTLLAPRWARLIFMLLVAGVLVASWDVTTSSGLG